MTAVVETVNVGLLLGTGMFGDDVLYKLPWLRPLKGKHEIFVASRVSPEVHVGEQMKQVIGNPLYDDVVRGIKELKQTVRAFEVVYDTPHLQKRYTIEEVRALESWLGFSFPYLASFDQSFYSRATMTESRDSGLIDYCAGLTAFFKDFYASHRIDFLVVTLEDDIFSTIAHHAARRSGARVIGLVPGRFPRRGLAYFEEYTDLCPSTDAVADWEEIMSMYAETTIVNKEFQDLNARYFKLSSVRDRLRGLRFQTSYKAFMKHVTARYPQEKYIIDITNFRREIPKYLLKLYRRKTLTGLITEPAPEDKYFLFPLHFMDDAQITFREPLLDQIRLIEDISRALPSGHFLYIKPHPHYFGEDVPHGDLKRVSRLANVKLVNPRLPSIKLMKGATGVITINSTVGVEAVILGVPVITMGHDFFCKEGLSCVVRDMNDMPAALIDVASGRFRPDRERTKKYIGAIYANQVWFKGISYDFGYYGITDEEGKPLGEALGKILDNYRTLKP